MWQTVELQQCNVVHDMSAALLVLCRLRFSRPFMGSGLNLVSNNCFRVLILLYVKWSTLQEPGTETETEETEEQLFELK